MNGAFDHTALLNRTPFLSSEGTRLPVFWELVSVFRKQLAIPKKRRLYDLFSEIRSDELWSIRPIFQAIKSIKSWGVRHSQKFDNVPEAHHCDLERVRV
jgi:hypothetical protein